LQRNSFGVLFCYNGGGVLYIFCFAMRSGEESWVGKEVKKPVDANRFALGFHCLLLDIVWLFSKFQSRRHERVYLNHRSALWNHGDVFYFPLVFLSRETEGKVDVLKLSPTPTCCCGEPSTPPISHDVMCFCTITFISTSLLEECW